MLAFLKQLVVEFAKKENIQLDGAGKAEILLARDTRPSGESLLEAAKQVWVLLEHHGHCITLVYVRAFVHMYIQSEKRE